MRTKKKPVPVLMEVVERQFVGDKQIDEDTGGDPER